MPVKQMSVKLNKILSLDPQSIYSYIGKYPNKDLPLMIHYWKLELIQYYKTDKKLYEHLLDYRSNQESQTNHLVKGLLGSELLKNIYTDFEPLSVVLKSHLIFENFINRIFEKNNLNYKKLSFFSKVDLLYKRNLLREDLSKDLKLLNKLRNNFAHNYYFDISNYDMSNFSICKGFYDGLSIKEQKTKGMLNIVAFQYYILHYLLGRISYDFPFLTKLKVINNINKIALKEDFGYKIGKFISETNKLIKNTNFGLTVELKISRKSNKKSTQPKAL